jgi:tetratricopeptide (TPR) repeat protein
VPLRARAFGRLAPGALRERLEPAARFFASLPREEPAVAEAALGAFVDEARSGAGDASGDLVEKLDPAARAAVARALIALDEHDPGALGDRELPRSLASFFVTLAKSALAESDDNLSYGRLVACALRAWPPTALEFETVWQELQTRIDKKKADPDATIDTYADGVRTGYLLSWPKVVENDLVTRRIRERLERTAKGGKRDWALEYALLDRLEGTLGLKGRGIDRDAVHDEIVALAKELGEDPRVPRSIRSRIWQLKGRVHMSFGEPDAAAEAFSRAHEDNPFPAVASYSLSNQLLESWARSGCVDSKKLEAAIAAGRRAVDEGARQVALSPAPPETDQTGAVPLIRIAPSEEEFYERIQVALVHALIAHGDFDEAAKLLEGPAPRHPETAWGIRIAKIQVFVAWGRIPEARSLVDAALRDESAVAAETHRRSLLERAGEDLAKWGRGDAKAALEKIVRAALEARPASR